MSYCNWGNTSELNLKYHDEEWGIPVYDDVTQFEYLMLEVMQCGLNWNMMINKREIFRKCFDNFDYDKISKYKLTIIDDDIDIIQIKEYVETVKPEYVFIDYIQLIKLPANVERDSAMLNFMKELKVIANQNNCIIFITSQVSRTVKRRNSKWPMLHDLKEYGCLEDISDVVLFIYREEYYNLKDEYNKGKAQINIAKNKNGYVGTVNILFKANIIKFLEAPSIEIF